MFFDTETTGLPKNPRAPVEDLRNWPRAVQIAWARFDARERHLETRSFIIKPEGFIIPKDAQRVHGISTAKATAEGKPLRTVLRKLGKAFENSKILVAHNLAFDENVIGAEFLRKGFEVPFVGIRGICTMIGSTNYCRLPGHYGYKWPTLAELHWALFREEPEKGHNAAVDVSTCAKCFFELKRRRVINVGGQAALNRRTSHK